MDFDKIRQYGKLELLAKQMVEGFITGLHKSPYHGFSVEFAEHNLYNPGESIRHIDWKLYGRTDRLYTKRYEEETNLRAMVVLDRSPSMYYPMKDYAKLNFSIMSAACLSYMLHKQRDAVGLCTFAEGIEDMSQVKSMYTHIHQLFLKMQRLMEQTPSQKGTNVAEVLHEVAERIHKCSLVVIFSDMMEQAENQEEIFSALQHLKHNKHEVLLFHVVDKQTELDFSFEERPTLFYDVETGEEEKLQPAQVREYYQKRIHDLHQEVKLKCGQYKIDYIEADCRKDIDQILIPYLIKRSRMNR